MAIQGAPGRDMLTSLTSQCILGALQTTTLVEYPATIATIMKIGGGRFFVALLHAMLLPVATSQGM